MKTGPPVVLGLDFGGTKIAVSAADDAGRRLGTRVVPTDPGRGARWNLEQGIEAGRALLREVTPDAALAGVGASTFGIPEPDRIRLAPAIPGWEGLALERELRHAFACEHVRVMNDVKAAATAELRVGALQGCRHGIYVNLGTGLAAALVVGGEVVLGANGAAGEIGYSLVDHDGLLAAEHEVLEDVASGIGLAAAAGRRTGRRLSAADVFASGEFDDLVEAFRTQLAFHLANLAVALNPARIAVGGGMVRAWHQLEPTLRRALDVAVPFPPELVVGAFPFEAALVGALALARADEAPLLA